MKKLILCFASFTFFSSAFAAKTYMGLVPTSTDFYAIVSMTEKPCVAGDENAIYMAQGQSGKVSALGCWKLEGNTVKVEWTKGDRVPNHFDFSLFKPISDDGSTYSKQSSKVVLNCSAPDWVGDILVERDEFGVLKKLIVAGDDISFVESGTAINFSYKGKNISLSSTTGIFSFETSGFQSYLNNRLLGAGNVKGTGSCKLADAKRKF